MPPLLNRHAFSLLVSVLLTLLFLSPGLAGAIEFRAGLEQNPPLSFIDDRGKPSGLLVDILDHVAAREGWQVTYIPDTFQNCLKKLSNHEIDLMVTIAYSDERAMRFDFNKINVVANWGMLYASPDAAVQSYFDLQGKEVAVVKDDTHQGAFRALLKSFDIPVSYREVDDFEGVFRSIDAGQADAGVVSRFFGLSYEQNFSVKPTPLIFNPIEVRYATARGINGPLLKALDRNLRELKEAPDSVYYQSLDRWLGVAGNKGLPVWVKPVLLALGTLLAAAVVFAALLRWQVIVRTRKLNQEVIKRNVVQRELAQAEQNYRKLVENANAIILRWDLQGDITYINDYGERLFGFEKNELIGQNVLGTIVADVSVDGADLVEMIHAICEDPEKFQANENENITKTGERIWISWRNQPDHDLSGNLSGILSVGQDITERKNAEEARLQYDRAKDTFISTAAHELRTPLTAIIGYLELLTGPPGLEAFPADKQKQYLQTISDRSFMLARIVDDLLDISRIQQGKALPLKMMKGSITALAKHLIGQYQTLYPTHTFHLQVADEFDDDHYFDSERITQVLENLLSNAVKYSAPGSEVVTRILPTEEGVQVSVSDQGIGMSREQAEKVFVDFYRADHSNTAAGGLGLGMCIARQIVLEHGGQIWVDSTLDVGTEVCFTLPGGNRAA